MSIPQAARTAEPPPAPFERLAARVTFDELAPTMADLERRLTGRVTTVRTISSIESQGRRGRRRVAEAAADGLAVTPMYVGRIDRHRARAERPPDDGRVYA